MSIARHHGRVVALGVAAIAVLAIVSGCSQGPAAATKPEVDGADAAARALELYDANADQALDETELAKCPPLAAARANYDANNDARLTADEIANRLNVIAGANSAFCSVSCVVTMSGRQLEGAAVKLRPVEFIGDALPTATGTTDASGTASPAVAADLLPAELAQANLIFPGLYHVEVTHPQTTIPPRYNTATELGWDIDPSSRTGTSARFDLKSN